MGSDRTFLAFSGIALGMVALGMMAMMVSARVRKEAASGSTPSLSELQGRFDHEDDAVRKAKLIQKLGDAQFEALHAAEKAEDYNTAGVTLEKYRDNVRAALAGLQKAHPDAERQSNGYRQLQMHLNRGIHEVEEALRAAPDEYKPPLQLVRMDLTGMNDELLLLLFPRQPDAKAGVTPSVAPGVTPDEKPDVKPGVKPGTKPGAKPDLKEVRL